MGQTKNIWDKKFCMAKLIIQYYEKQKLAAL